MPRNYRFPTRCTLIFTLALLVAACGGTDEAPTEEVPATAPEPTTEAPADPAEAARQEGEAFLTENREREGIQETESGLQYEVIEEGDGARPGPTDVVSVHYEGSFVDGEVFESSYEGGEPVQFPLNQVIPGWTEGIQLMTEGSTYKFYIPSDLAYGTRGAGGVIGPNETLVFKVELLDIQE